MANYQPDRERILSDAIGRATSAGWQLRSRAASSAEFVSPDGSQMLVLQVNEQGQVQQQQRAAPPPSTSNPLSGGVGAGGILNQIGLISSIALAAWVIVVVVITLLVGLFNQSRLGFDGVAYTKGSFWLLVGLLLYVAARFSGWKS